MYTDKDLENLAEEYIEEGLKAMEQNRLKDAVKLTENGLQIYKQIGDLLNVAVSYSRLGVLYSVFGNYEMAIDYYLAGLDIALKNDYKLQVSRIQNNIGSRFQELGQCEAAIRYYEKAERMLVYQEVRDDPLFTMLCLILFTNMSGTYYSLKDYNRASRYADKAQEFVEITNGTYEYSVLLLKCQIAWKTGKVEFVRKNLDLVIEGIIGTAEAKDLEENVRRLVDLLKEMSEFQKLETVLLAFEKFAEMQDDVYFYMRSAQMWSKYYREIGQTEKYNLACVDFLNFYERYYEQNKIFRSQAISQKIEFKERAVKLSDSIERLHEDLLTGLGDMTMLQREYQGILSVGEEDETEICMGMINVDFFKEANETYGHLKCDEILKIIAGVIGECSSKYGSAYRIGGDQFVVLMNDCDVKSITSIAESIRTKINGLKIKNENVPGEKKYITVSQAYAFLNVGKQIGLKYCVDHVDRLLQKLRVETRDEYLIEDKAKRNYHTFYEKYNMNLEEEYNVEINFRDASSREEWIANLQVRDNRINELYESNEGLVAKYITPLLDGSNPLDDETSEVILKEIVKMQLDGKLDFLVMVEVCEYLEQYFAVKDYREEHITVLCLLVDAYMKLDHAMYYNKIIGFLDKLDKYRSYIEKLHRRSSRQMLATAYFSAGIFKAEFEKTSLRECIDQIHKDYSFFSDMLLEDRLNMSSARAVYYKDQYAVRILSRKLLSIKPDEVDIQDLREANDMLVALYASYSNEAGNSLDIDDNLFGAYQRSQFLLGKIDAKTAFENHKAYFERNMEYSSDNETEDLIDTRRFHLYLYCIPEMLRMAKALEGTDDEVDTYYIEGLVEKYVKYIKLLPKTGYSELIDNKIFDSLTIMMMNIPDFVDIVDFLFQIVVERDIDVTLHSYMVSEIAKLIVEMIYRNNPALLNGSLGIMGTENIMNSWPEVQQFVEKAGLIHDIGKINISHILKKMTRSLTTLEMKMVEQHTEFGARLIRNSEEMKYYVSMIMGHHKGWDDYSGFPKNYSYMDAPEPFLASVIQLADVLDVATSHGGKTAAHQKKVKDILAQIKEEKGRLYNPTLVNMMLRDEVFLEKYRELIKEGRNDICYEIYNSYLDENLDF